MSDPSLIWSYVFAAAVALHLLFTLYLGVRQVRCVARHRTQVPAAFMSRVPLSAHQKAADYTLVKTRLALLEAAWGAALLIAWTLLGGLATLNQTLSFLGVYAGLWQQLALVAAFGLIGTVLDLPFAWYRTFRVEERFGFNKTTLALWLLDLAKSAVLACLVGLPIIALILWLMGSAGPAWWLWAWGLWTAFQWLMLLLYPTWIAPWFNKFATLQDPQIKERVTALMQRCGLTPKGLFVMDGSRRSAHANAYFTGLGKTKRVVFYDTLLEQLNPAEIDAVLAHELGHFKHRHVIKRMLTMLVLSAGAFALLGYLSEQVWFYTGLGVRPNFATSALSAVPNNALALLLFMLVIPAFGFFLSFILAQQSRSHEFEADAYACVQTNAQDLSNALLKLYQDNASTLTPDSLFVKFYYSHPPASERLARLTPCNAPL